MTSIMILNNINQYKVILASNSPRRKGLLSELGIDYEVRPLADIDETFPHDLPGEEIPKYIARQKAEAYSKSMNEDELIITADTIVYIDGQVLGKPADREDAFRMLHQLSGRVHQVITGVCLTTRQSQRTFAVTSQVTFDALSDDEITYYIDQYRPFDKAGAYGIQEWIGYVAVSHIEGSYFNIMGLPIQRLYQELKQIK